MFSPGQMTPLRSNSVGQGTVTGEQGQSWQVLAGRSHPCKVPRSQHFLQMLRGAGSVAPVLESNRLWVKFQLLHLLALYPSTSCQSLYWCCCFLHACGFSVVIWKMVTMATGTARCIHIILHWTAAQTCSRGAWDRVGICASNCDFVFGNQ